MYEDLRAADTPQVAAATDTTPPFPVVNVALPGFLVDDAEQLTADKLTAISFPFVGREPELARLNGYLEAAISGRGQVAFVVGGPGRGKTALLRAFAERAMAAHSDLLAVNGTCNAYAGTGDAYLPFRDALGMLTGDVASLWSAGLVTRDHARRLWSALALVLAALVAHGPYVVGTLVPGRSLLGRAAEAGLDGAPWLPELKALSARLGGSTLPQSGLFRQVINVLRAVAVAHPLLIALDDLQWADPGSCGLLLYLGRQLVGSRILVVGAYRPEEVPMAGGTDGRAGAHPLTQVIYELRRLYGGVWVDLREADEARGKQFVKALIAAEPNRLGPGFQSALHAQTGGHPLFTVELLRTLQERGDLRRSEDGAWVGGGHLEWGALPARVEAVIAERLERLGPAARDLLTVASVEGETFTTNVVAQVQGLGQREMLRILDDLARHHRLVREADAVVVDGRHLARYSFAHALFQAYAYEQIGTATRRLLHGEVAVALEAVYGDESDCIAPQLAQHHDHADQPEQAAAWAIRAGDRSRLVYANEEAARWYQRALDRLESPALDEIGKAHRLTALSGLGKVRYHTGKREQAADLFGEAIALGRDLHLDPQELVLLYHWLGEALWWLNRYEERVRVGEEGWALVADQPRSIGAALMQQTIAHGALMLGEGERYAQLNDETAGFLADLPYIEELRDAYRHIIERYVTQEQDIASALAWLHIFRERAQRAGDLSALAAAESRMGAALVWTGDYVGGTQHQQAFLEASLRIGDTTNELFALEEMTQMMWFAGDLEAASSYGQRALALARRLDNRHCLFWQHIYLGLIALSGGDLGQALSELRDAEVLQPAFDPLAGCLQSRVHLASGDVTRAQRQLESALELVGVHDDVVVYPWAFCQMLNGLEEAYNDPPAYQAWVRRFRNAFPPREAWPAQWFLRPAVRQVCGGAPLLEDAFRTLESGWSWRDPLGDCTFAVGNGLEMRAMSWRDLNPPNLSAPRLLRPWLPGLVDAVVEVTCEPARDDRPAIGGLLLWRDATHFLRLEVGRYGKWDIGFGGCLGDKAGVIIGRGRLPEAPRRDWRMGESVMLHLEVSADRVAAKCSLDGERWYTVGEAAFAVDDTIQVGVHAIGLMWFNRAIYLGAHPEGTAIRFTDFRLWRTSEEDGTL
ncbi:MAG: AAA family ATPase [Anaerolineae bacterium]|nr:AAA family ATPase [Anaerolineae bacterium]